MAIVFHGCRFKSEGLGHQTFTGGIKAGKKALIPEKPIQSGNRDYRTVIRIHYATKWLPWCQIRLESPKRCRVYSIGFPAGSPTAYPATSISSVLIRDDSSRGAPSVISTISCRCQLPMWGSRATTMPFSRVCLPDGTM